ncbi:MAG: ABC transporter substrate-binding protein [Pseudolabrys sp.]|nr:ABC transporter substrate-binding protein [Pseudolabrys sp.]
MRKTMMKAALAALGVGLVSQPVLAQEKLKVATTFLGLWDTSQPTLCKERGEFAKAGLDVDVTSTRGGSENIQAVIAGGMDIGYSPGINAVFAAYAQGNKLKVVSSEFLGQNDTFFYVPADSPIKSTKDLNGKTVAFPRPGGASEATLLAFKNESKLDFKMVATGGMDATMTMAMTKQVDVGYAIPPSGLAAIEEGKIRVLFSGDDVKAQAKLTGRVIVTKADFLEKKRAVVAKFLETLDKCIDWAYANKKESSKFYGDLNKVDAKIAEKGIAFYDRKTLAFGPIEGLDVVMKQAVDAKFLAKPLTEAEIKDLIDIVYTTKK